MRIMFKSFGQLRRILGNQLVEIDVPEGSTVREVIDKVIATGGPELQRYIMSGNHISGNLILLLNKRDIDTLAGEDTIVKTGDELTVLPHVQGG
jgi:MoaD family protein